jgi:hypothetical protein
MATRYGLDDPQIESRWRRDFLHLFRLALWSTQPPVQCVPGLSRGKEAGAWRWLHPSTVEVKERIELYFSLSGPSWPVIGWSLHCLHIKYCHEWVMTWPCEILRLNSTYRMTAQVLVQKKRTGHLLLLLIWPLVTMARHDDDDDNNNVRLVHEQCHTCSASTLLSTL